MVNSPKCRFSCVHQRYGENGGTVIAKFIAKNSKPERPLETLTEATDEAVEQLVDTVVDFILSS